VNIRVSDFFTIDSEEMKIKHFFQKMVSTSKTHGVTVQKTTAFPVALKI
jgi:hypothetical protein